MTPGLCDVHSSLIPSDSISDKRSPEGASTSISGVVANMMVVSFDFCKKTPRYATESRER